MEEFIDYAEVIVGTLGHKLFEPIDRPVSNEKDAPLAEKEPSVELILEREIKNIGKITAKGKQTAEGFVVLKGSMISPAVDHTVSVALIDRRKKAQIDGNWILQEDVLFTSPSSAAIFVVGKSANGLISWKTADGWTLKSLEESSSTEYSGMAL